MKEAVTDSEVFQEDTPATVSLNWLLRSLTARPVQYIVIPLAAAHVLPGGLAGDSCCTQEERRRAMSASQSVMSRYHHA